MRKGLTLPSSLEPLEMEMLLLLIAGVWIAALLLVAGLCAAADRGEADVLRAARARQAATEDARGTEPAEAALRIAA